MTSVCVLQMVLFRFCMYTADAVALDAQQRLTATENDVTALQGLCVACRTFPVSVCV